MIRFRPILSKIQKLPHKPLLVSILILVALRLASLPFSPPGFFVDEAATGAHTASMVLSGTDAHGDAWPGFSASLGGGYTTPVYLYPLVAWAHLFGFSELSLRYFSQWSTLLAIGLLAGAVWFWLGTRTALIAAIVGLALPWGWLQGSIAWDPALVPFFAALSFFSFSALLFSGRRLIRYGCYTLLPLSLVGLAYVYPPCRVTAPILFLAYLGVLYYKKRLHLAPIMANMLLAAVLAIPLLLFMTTPEALERSRHLSILYGNSPVGAAGALISNVALLLNPLFLFVQGDGNMRHATGLAGMLGWGAIIPLAAAIWFVARRNIQQTFSEPQRHRLMLLVLIGAIGILASILGSALTNEGQPHSLRACAAWTFFVLLITVGWTVLEKAAKPSIRSIAVGIFICSTVAYAVHLVCIYPSRAASYFHVPARQKLLQGQHIRYPELARKYYELRRMSN